GEMVEVFAAGGGEKMAHDMGVPFLGRIPLDPHIVSACDSGEPYVSQFDGTPAATAFKEVIACVNGSGSEQISSVTEEQQRKETGKMRIAIPVMDGRLCMHFGHCEKFALIDVDATGKKIEKTEFVVPPPHEPGLLPRWLGEKGADVIIAGGMGQRAQGLFAQNGVQVIVGAPANSPEDVALAYLDGTLETGDNVCDH
ncbi:NifB/NifX family molybdenum-iron cluster-binding protein, partial [Candidatus Hydrogenedentota bacterium]